MLFEHNHFNITKLCSFPLQCAETNKLSWNKLKACVEGDEGRNLLLEYGKATEDAEVMYVPHILLNDIKSEKAQNNFLEAVCELFTEKPSGCQNIFAF